MRVAPGGIQFQGSVHVVKREIKVALLAVEIRNRQVEGSEVGVQRQAALHGRQGAFGIAVPVVCDAE